MITRRVVRRVTKRAYDKYSFVDYSASSDNLNPLNPTALEAQYAEIRQAVRGKLIEAYNQAKVQVPEDLLEYDASPSQMLNDLNDLINKTKKNQLSALLDKIGGNSDLVSSIIAAGDLDFFDNPPRLDCDGVDLFGGGNGDSDDDDDNLNVDLGSDGDEDDDSKEGDSGGDSKDSGDSGGSGDGTTGPGGDPTGNIGKATIVYNGVIEEEDKKSNWRTEISETEFPLTPSLLGTSGRAFNCPDGQIFEGWYLDQFFSEKLSRVNFTGNGSIINVWLRFIDENDDDGEEDDTPPTPDLGGDDDDDTCDLINLSWLKIILIIVTVLGILVKVLVLIQNIMKAIADIAKDAQLCWINPPSLQSLISYVMQRLGAVIFQIVGMILLKLWAMLNLDCLSDMTMNTIEEINAALSNLMSAIAEVESTALDFKGAGGDLASSILEMINNLKEEMRQQAQNLKETFANMKDTLTSQAEWQKLGQELADVYSNPQTYLEMVPPEIKAKVLQAIDTYESTKKNITNIINTQKSIFSKKNKEEDSTPALPRNVEMTYL